MSKDSIINELIRVGVFKAEDDLQLYELSSAELLELLEGERMKEFYQQALEYETTHVRYWAAKEKDLRSRLEMATAQKRHHENEQAKLQRMIENEGREGNETNTIV